MELLVEDLEIEPKPSSDTVKKHLDALLASMNEYAKFLRDLQKEVEISTEKEELTSP